MWLGRLITSGVDVWLNTPLRPNEASGTSGMKASLNGVPNLSVLDGWWSEGCIDGVNGWAVGNPNEISDESDADHLYNLIENNVIPSYYGDKDDWSTMMKEYIKTVISYTSHRMVTDYKNQYYKL